MKSSKAKRTEDLRCAFAATALVHGLTIATRNQTDFRVAGVKLLDPFA
jgi:predicted nucleic acid-binding protein